MCCVLLAVCGVLCGVVLCGVWCCGVLRDIVRPGHAMDSEGLSCSVMRRPVRSCHSMSCAVLEGRVGSSRFWSSRVVAGHVE